MSKKVLDELYIEVVNIDTQLKNIDNIDIHKINKINKITIDNNLLNTYMKLFESNLPPNRVIQLHLNTELKIEHLNLLINEFENNESIMKILMKISIILKISLNAHISSDHIAFFLPLDKCNKFIELLNNATFE